MTEMGIAGVCPWPNLSKRNHEMFPYLLRDFEAAYRTGSGGRTSPTYGLFGDWMYLLAFVDWYYRYVVN